MKPVYIALAVGLILLYFVDTALKIDLFNLEMLIHSAIRFFSGFIILGLCCFYAGKLHLKISLYLVLALLVADDILDFYRGVTPITAQMILFGLYMLCWGSVTGYFAGKAIQTN